MALSLRRSLLRNLVILIGIAALVLIGLTGAGRRFAIQQVFNEINSMARVNEEDDKASVIHWTKELATATDPRFRADIQQVLSMAMGHQSRFLCIDAVTRDLFTIEQLATLEKSLRSYYDQVYWGKENIPGSLFTEDGELKNGSVVGYSIKVYPGVVKLDYYSWSGMLSGVGHTKVYVWYGLGYRFYRQSRSWIS